VRFRDRVFADPKYARVAQARGSERTEGWKGPGQGPTVRSVMPSEFYDRLLQKQERYAPISYKSGVTQFD